MVNWTRGHFELIADTVSEESVGDNERLCRAFADELSSKNRRFDRGKFLNRCKSGEVDWNEKIY